MPTYTGSRAQSGRGSVLSIGFVTGSSGTETFTLIGEISMTSPTGAQWGTEDTTNFESGNSQEFAATILDNGTLSLSGNRVSIDAGQIALQAAFQTGLKYDFKLVLPLAQGQSSAGDTYIYSALVQNYEFTVETTKIIKFTAKLKISGQPAFTVGS